MAGAGIASRRRCEELIVGGRVTVNGQVAAIGMRADPLSDAICLDGVRLPVNPNHVYYLLNKELGVVSTVDDPYGRRTVVDCVPGTVRVYPVGRLDAGSEGLILLTNDGDLAYRVTHPSFGIDKEYLVQVEGRLSKADTAKLRTGVKLDDGLASATSVSVIAPDTLTITVREGRNRMVRRMCDAIGHPVVRLVRIRIGPVTSRSLQPGSYRQLDRDELNALFESVGSSSVRAV
ncbi:MAG: rRNA pseudouridine synthase [Actinobacteria bacterium]|nr:rRNA pseudouridine synthase [Actinomycetota bacterium]MCL5445880.1 rRNA pseudouridine synthase [Actinomycetota bacterium]